MLPTLLVTVTLPLEVVEVMVLISVVRLPPVLVANEVPVPRPVGPTDIVEPLIKVNELLGIGALGIGALVTVKMVVLLVLRRTRVVVVSC